MGKQSGLGAGLDSFYEYLLKSYILFGEKEDLDMFNAAYHSIQSYLRRGYVCAAPAAPSQCKFPLLVCHLGVKRCISCLLLHRRSPKTPCSELRTPHRISRTVPGCGRGSPCRVWWSQAVLTRWPEPLAVGWGSRQLGPLVGGSWQLPSERETVYFHDLISERQTGAACI